MPAELDIDIGEAHSLAHHSIIFFAAPTKREITRWFGASIIEMLMKPIGRRNDHAARAPIKSLNLADLGPHQRITLAGQDDDVCSGTMIMCLLVSPNRKLGDMAAECVL